MVESNVKTANVFQDGLLIGRVGQKLEGKPGPTTLVVSAAGYQSRQINVQVFEGRETKLTADLTKVEAKPVAASKPPKTKKRQRVAPPAQEENGLFANEPADPFEGRDLTSEFASDRVKPAKPVAGANSERPAEEQNAPPQQAVQATQQVQEAASPQPAVITAPPLPQNTAPVAAGGVASRRASPERRDPTQEIGFSAIKILSSDKELCHKP